MEPRLLVHDPSKYKLLRVADASTVEFCTQTGWVLLAMSEDERVELQQRQEVMQPLNSNVNGSYGTPGQTIACMTPLVVKQTRYLMGLDEESAVKALHKDIETAKAERQKAGEAVVTAQAELDAARTAVGAARTEITRLQKANEVMEARANASASETVKVKESFNKVEKDMLKLRAHFGEKAVKEALSGGG